MLMTQISAEISIYLKQHLRYVLYFTVKQYNCKASSMPDNSDDLHLIKELENLLGITMSLTRIMESQQEQISFLVDILERILDDPTLLHDNQAPLRKLIADIRAKEAELN